MDTKKLFARESLQDQLAGRRGAFIQEINKIAQAEFDASTDEQVVSHIVARAQLTPLKLDESKAWIDFENIKVDVSKDPRRFFDERPRGPFFVDGTRAIISIPYEGEEWVFDYQTNPHYPYANLVGATSSAMFDDLGDVIRITVDSANDDDGDSFERRISEQREILRRFVQIAASQVRAFNQSLEGHVRHEVTARRSRTSQHRAIATRLDIPLKKRRDAPPLEPVAVFARAIPPLGTARSGNAEYGISDENHKLILHFIRHQGRTYEATPDTYAMHDEEGLRDIILGQLNGHFLGGASGETFRGRGKTDIRIEAGDRSAFVAECKLWKGKAGIRKALGQLLDYVVWRDSKAALVVFNKSQAGMPLIVERLPCAIQESGFACDTPKEVGVGEWSTIIQQKGGNGHRLAVWVFAFDIRPRKPA